MLPRSPEIPSAHAGVIVAARTASASGIPIFVTAVRKHAMTLLTLPASDPFSIVARLPCTVNSCPPSSKVPSPSPHARSESLIKIMRSGKSENARRTIEGAICTPSAIISQVTSRRLAAAAIGPGSR